MNLADMISCMRLSPLFSTLDDEALQALAAHASNRHYEDGEFIIRENSANNELFLITRGEVKITINGTEVARQAAGETIGEISMSNISPPVADVSAVGKVNAIAIPAAELRAFCSHQPDFAIRLRATGLQKVYGR